MIFTSHTFSSGCGNSRSRQRWSYTRYTCCLRGRGGTSSWVNGSSPNRNSTSRSIRNSSRRRDAHACRWGCGNSRFHSSRFRSICISFSLRFSLHGASISQFRRMRRKNITATDFRDLSKVVVELLQPFNEGLERRVFTRRHGHEQREPASLQHAQHEPTVRRPSAHRPPSSGGSRPHGDGRFRRRSGTHF